MRHAIMALRAWHLIILPSDVVVNGWAHLCWTIVLQLLALATNIQAEMPETVWAWDLLHTAALHTCE